MLAREAKRHDMLGECQFCPEKASRIYSRGAAKWLHGAGLCTRHFNQTIPREYDKALTMPPPL